MVAEAAAAPVWTGATTTTRMEALNEGDEAAPTASTLQMTDEELMDAQQHSKLVQHLLKDGKYRSMKIESAYGLVTIVTPHGRRVLLPPVLWTAVFKEMHGSVWAGHLR